MNLDFRLPALFGGPEQALTPETIERRRQMALALMQEGTDASPVQHWTQGAARMAKALAGLSMERRANAAAGTGKREADSIWGDTFGGPQAAPQAPSVPGPATPLAALQGAPRPAPAPPSGIPGDVGGLGRASPGMLRNPAAREGYAALVAAGYSPMAAAAIVGNAQAESGWNPVVSHDGNTGVGLLGFRDPSPGQGRKTALMQFAQQKGLDWRQPATQIQYVMSELAPGGREARAGDMLRAAKSPEAAQAAMMHYLRPAGFTPQNPQGGHNWGGRLANLNAALGAFGGGPAPAGPQSPGAPPGLHLAQAPATRTGQTGPTAQQLMRIINHPFSSPTQRQIAQQLLVRQMEPKDPADAQLKQLQILEAQKRLNDPVAEAQKLVMLQKSQKELAGDWETVRGEHGQVFQRNKATGELRKVEGDERTTLVKEYQEAKKQGFEGSIFDYKKKLAEAGSTKFGVNLGGGTDKQIFDEMQESTKIARSAAVGLNALREVRQSIKGGMITGFGADARLNLQRLGAAIGVADSSKIVNTETFRSAIAPHVATLLKATVGNAQISNTDREFAERAAGGQIALDEGTIKRLVETMEKMNREVLKDHTEKLEAVYPDGPNFRRERAMFRVRAPLEDTPTAPVPGAVPVAPVAPPAAVAPPPGGRVLKFNPVTGEIE